MSDCGSKLSEEILLKTFSYIGNTREVIAAAGTCRSWRNIVRGPKCVPFVKNLTKKHWIVPSLLKATIRLNALNGVQEWFDLLVRIETLCLLADKKRRRNLNAAAESFRGRTNDLLGVSLYSGGKPYQGPTSGTTATSTPDANGRFAEPVYYDWGANWDRVSELVETKEVQEVLMSCVNEVADDYYLKDWNEETIWPFLFVSHRRYGNGEQDDLIAKHLTPSLVKDLNDIAADRLLMEGEKIISSDRKKVAVQLALWELERGYEVDEDTMHEVVDEMFDIDDDMFYNGELYDIVSYHVRRAVEAIIYSKSGPGSVREVLLCTMGASFDFMPLNYSLAKLVSPKGTKLKNCMGGAYSVVYDAKRNIVFDNFWYFIGKSAPEALRKSRG